MIKMETNQEYDVTILIPSESATEERNLTEAFDAVQNLKIVLPSDAGRTIEIPVNNFPSIADPNSRPQNCDQVEVGHDYQRDTWESNKNFSKVLLGHGYSACDQLESSKSEQEGPLISETAGYPSAARRHSDIESYAVCRLLEHSNSNVGGPARSGLETENLTSLHSLSKSNYLVSESQSGPNSSELQNLANFILSFESNDSKPPARLSRMSRPSDSELNQPYSTSSIVTKPCTIQPAVDQNVSSASGKLITTDSTIDACMDNTVERISPTGSMSSSHSEHMDVDPSEDDSNQEGLHSDSELGQIEQLGPGLESTKPQDMKGIETNEVPRQSLEVRPTEERHKNATVKKDVKPLPRVRKLLRDEKQIEKKSVKIIRAIRHQKEHALQDSPASGSQDEGQQKSCQEMLSSQTLGTTCSKLQGDVGLLLQQKTLDKQVPGSESIAGTRNILQDSNKLPLIQDSMKIHENFTQEQNWKVSKLTDENPKVLAKEKPMTTPNKAGDRTFFRVVKVSSNKRLEKLKQIKDTPDISPLADSVNKMPCKKVQLPDHAPTSQDGLDNRIYFKVSKVGSNKRQKLQQVEQADANRHLHPSVKVPRKIIRLPEHAQNAENNSTGRVCFQVVKRGSNTRIQKLKQNDQTSAKRLLQAKGNKALHNNTQLSLHIEEKNPLDRSTPFFLCQSCLSYFASKQSLKLHREECRGPFHCDTCKVAFTYRRSVGAYVPSEFICKNCKLSFPVTCKLHRRSTSLPWFKTCSCIFKSAPINAVPGHTKKCKSKELLILSSPNRQNTCKCPKRKQTSDGGASAADDSKEIPEGNMTVSLTHLKCSLCNVILSTAKDLSCHLYRMYGRLMCGDWTVSTTGGHLQDGNLSRGHAAQSLEVQHPLQIAKDGAKLARSGLPRENYRNHGISSAKHLSLRKRKLMGARKTDRTKFHSSCEVKRNNKFMGPVRKTLREEFVSVLETAILDESSGKPTKHLCERCGMIDFLEQHAKNCNNVSGEKKVLQSKNTLKELIKELQPTKPQEVSSPKVRREVIHLSLVKESDKLTMGKNEKLNVSTVAETDRTDSTDVYQVMDMASKYNRGALRTVTHCSSCKKAFMWKSSLKRHKCSKVFRQHYLCYICGNLCASEATFEKHLETHLQDRKSVPSQLCPSMPCSDSLVSCAPKAISIKRVRKILPKPTLIQINQDYINSSNSQTSPSKVRICNENVDSTTPEAVPSKTGNNFLPKFTPVQTSQDSIQSLVPKIIRANTGQLFVLQASSSTGMKIPFTIVPRNASSTDNHVSSTDVARSHNAAVSKTTSCKDGYVPNTDVAPKTDNGKSSHAYGSCGKSAEAVSCQSTANSCTKVPLPTPEENNLICEQCNKYFIRKSSLIRHINKFHPERKQLASNEKLLVQDTSTEPTPEKAKKQKCGKVDKGRRKMKIRDQDLRTRSKHETQRKDQSLDRSRKPSHVKAKKITKHKHSCALCENKSHRTKGRCMLRLQHKGSMDKAKSESLIHGTDKETIPNSPAMKSISSLAEENKTEESGGSSVQIGKSKETLESLDQVQKLELHGQSESVDKFHVDKEKTVLPDEQAGHIESLTAKGEKRVRHKLKKRARVPAAGEDAMSVHEPKAQKDSNTRDTLIQKNSVSINSSVPKPISLSPQQCVVSQTYSSKVRICHENVDSTTPGAVPSKIGINVPPNFTLDQTSQAPMNTSAPKITTPNGCQWFILNTLSSAGIKIPFIIVPTNASCRDKNISNTAATISQPTAVSKITSCKEGHVPITDVASKADDNTSNTDVASSQISAVSYTTFCKEGHKPIMDVSQKTSLSKSNPTSFSDDVQNALSCKEGHVTNDPQIATLKTSNGSCSKYSEASSCKSVPKSCTTIPLAVSEKKYYKCEPCNRYYIYLSSYSRHINKCHPEKKNLVLKEKRLVQAIGRRAQHPEKKFSRCELCYKYFISPRTLTCHIIKYHLERKDENLLVQATGNSTQKLPKKVKKKKCGKVDQGRKKMKASSRDMATRKKHVGPIKDPSLDKSREPSLLKAKKKAKPKYSSTLCQNRSPKSKGQCKLGHQGERNMDTGKSKSVKRGTQKETLTISPAVKSLSLLAKRNKTPESVGSLVPQKSVQNEKSKRSIESLDQVQKLKLHRQSESVLHIDEEKSMTAKGQRLVGEALSYRRSVPAAYENAHSVHEQKSQEDAKMKDSKCLQSLKQDTSSEAPNLERERIHDKHSKDPSPLKVAFHSGFSCDQCDGLRFSSRREFGTHMLTHLN